MELMTFEVPEDIGLAATETESEETKLEAFETKPASDETNENTVETIEPAVDEPAETGCPVGQDCQDQPATDEASATKPLPTLISDGIGEWQLACKRIEHEISDLVIERVGLQERNKSIRKRIDCLAEELAELRAEGPQTVWRTTEQPPTPPANCGSVGAESVTVTFSIPENSGTTSPSADVLWRSTPIGSLEKHGLKSSVLEKLVEAGIETIGKLEDRRADISQGREKWPKGIGAAKITQIEDAVIAWLTENRDRNVFAVAAEKVSEEIAKSEADNTALKYPTSEEWDAKSEKQIQQWITDRLDAIKEGVFGDTDDRDTWDSGRQAFDRGIPLFDCPYIPSQQMDDWLRGWNFGFEQYKESNDMGEPRDTPQAAEPAISIDDL